MMACQETTESNPETTEPNPKMEYESERREVPTEEAAVKSSGTMKNRHRGRHLAAGQRREQEELTRGDCRSRRKLAAACRKVSRRAAVAWSKRTVVRKDLTRNKVERGAPKRRKDKKRLWKCPECNNGMCEWGLREQLLGNKRIKDPGDRWPRYLMKERTTTANGIGGWKSGQRLLLGSGGTHMKALYEIVSVKLAKQIAGSYVASRTRTGQCGGVAPSETEEERTSPVCVRTAGNVGAPATVCFWTLFATICLIYFWSLSCILFMTVSALLLKSLCL
jgi:hypothetical protein